MRSRSQASLGVLSLACVIILAACGGQAPADRTASAGTAAAPSAEVAKHMHEHLAKVTDVQAAVIRGDMQGAKESARWIADHHEVEGLPDNSRPSVDEMKKAARAVANAADIKAAAQGSAQMAAACGTCHAASNSKPVFQVPAPPAPKNDTVAHMLAHKHAVDLLYQGLAVPSDEAWAQGANSLKSAPLMPKAAGKSDKPSKEGEKAEADTHAMADKALAAKDPKTRGEVYAELVGQCASCHALYGRVLGEGVPKQ